MTNNNKFNEIKIYVSCRINDDVEIKVYKNQPNLRVLVYPFTGLDKLYVHVAGEKICEITQESLNSRYNIKCTHNMHIKNLSGKFISWYANMTCRYQLQQPRPMIESEMVKHLKYMSHEEQINNYNFLTCKHKLSSL